MAPWVVLIDCLEGRAHLALPTPWLEAMVGSPLESGSATLSGGTMQLAGSGSVGGTSDQFRYAFQPLSGDGYVIARVTSIGSPDALAGITIRQSLSAGSPFAQMVARQDGSTRFQFRLSSNARVYERPASAAASWLKVTRIRNMLTGYASTDGQSWTQVGTETLVMGIGVTVGLFVSSQSTAQVTGTFSSVVIPQNIVRYGASVDAADNVPAIHAALAASANSGNEVFVPAGTFRTAQVIELAGAKRLFGVGAFGVNPRNPTDVSVLMSTNVNAAPVRLSGSGVRLSDLQLSTTYTGSRLTADRTTAVYVDGASNFVVSGVEVAKSASGGIFVTRGANGGLITGNRVHNTLADGIHITNGSFNITVEKNVVHTTGDDQIAAVGYYGKFDAQGKQWAPPTNIVIRDNAVTNTGMANGRGIAAVGAKDVLIDNNTITDSPASGVIIVSESAYSTLAGDGITVTRNRIVNPNTTNLSGATGNHGGIYIGGRSGFPVTNVTLGDPLNSTRGNTITNAKGGGVTIAGYTSGIRVFNTNIDTVTGYGIRAYDSANVTISGNTLKRIARHGIYLHGVNGGTFSIMGNVLENINTSNAAGNDAINVAASGAYTSLSITNNSYSNPIGYVVDRFIECHFATALVSGNTTNTGKSIYVGA
ncbi:MAG: right-handed parallel beta-helix repeat-containing protein [Tepidisphaeraceae bacterium]